MVKNKPVAEALKLIGDQGEFLFSYNSDIISGDSLVSISVKSGSIKQVLDVLLKGICLYKEAGNNQPIVYRFQTDLNIKLSKRFSLSGGPAFSLFSSEQKEFEPEYQTFTDKGFFRFKVNQNTQAWLGWQAGFSWNYRQF